MQKINPVSASIHKRKKPPNFIAPCSKILMWTKLRAMENRGPKFLGKKKDPVMTVEFELAGFQVLGLNGGPLFKFTPAPSFFVWCDDEKEIDSLWQNLSQGGTVRMGMDKYPWAPKYGWTADKYGVSLQIVPTVLGKLLSDPDPKKAEQVMQAMLKMKKLDIKKLEAAYKQ